MFFFKCLITLVWFLRVLVIPLMISQQSTPWRRCRVWYESLHPTLVVVVTNYLRVSIMWLIRAGLLPNTRLWPSLSQPFCVHTRHISSVTSHMPMILLSFLPWSYNACCFLQVAFSLVRSADKMNHHNCTSHSHIFQFFFYWYRWAVGGGGKLPRQFKVIVCCVCMSPLPSLNQEGRSEKRLRSTTSVFLLCVCETPDGCLSHSHANAGPGTMVTAGPHMQKAEVSQGAEEVIGFLMAIVAVSWEIPTGPLRRWECHS